MVDMEGLTPECARCTGLCCTALPFAASADFPESKPAGLPCRHLQPDDACGIHADLRALGWRGCTVFECFGAGQQVTQHTFAGTSWRDGPQVAGEVFAAFEAIRVVQEVRYYLRLLGAEALSAPLARRVAALDDAARGLANAPAAELTQDAVRRLHGRAGPLLRDASRELRGRGARPAGGARPSGRRGEGPPIAPYADLAGADLRAARLDGADLRGAVLIGADLRRVTLNRTDVLGADLRDARLAGGDLRTALFLTQTQVNAALGDAATQLPGHLRAPHHWGAGRAGG